MEIKKIREEYAKIQLLIIQKRIKEALDILKERAKKTQVAIFIDEIYSIDQSYKTIIEHALFGFDDPQKEIPYNALINKLTILSDQINSVICEHFFKKYLNGHYSNQNDEIATIYNKILTEYNSNDEVFQLLREESITELFNAFAFSAYSTNSEMEIIENAFYQNNLNENEMSNLISALHISLSNYYDERKIEILLNLVECDNQAIAARASVIFVMTLIKYDTRITHQPNLQKCILKLSENTLYVERFKTIYFQLLKAKQTEKISQKFTNEILPEMIKINPIIQKKLDLENLLSDKTGEEILPDWDDLINESPELIEKIDQIHKMQQEGYDLLSTTFKNLKSFPFFNTINNWFIPFTTKNSYVIAIIKAHNNNEIRQLTSFLNNIPNVCNSDKYSMLFAMEIMPILYKDMLGKLPKEQLYDENSELTNSLLNKESNFKDLSNLYIQDHYRFQTAFNARFDFENIFEYDFAFQNNQTALSLVASTNFLKELGHSYFKTQNFEVATDVYIQFLKVNEPNVDILQKIGFSYQQLNKYENALNFYLQAELFDKNREWNQKKIALCYRNMNNPERALQYYLQAELENPDNLHTQVAIGQCYIELQNYSEALKHYFKVEFLDQSNTKIWRPIAWCGYVLGKFDVSEKYYSKLKQLPELTNHDIMSYGNLLLAMGKRKEAIIQYFKAITINFTLSQFIEAFNHEAIYLKDQGIDEIQISTLLDELRYSLEE